MMHYLDGIQEFTLEKAKSRIRNLPAKERKYFYVVKDKKPVWYSGPWKQTYTIRVKDYSKIKVWNY